MREYRLILLPITPSKMRLLNVLCFATTEEGIRVISFRKANTREARKYGKAKTID